MLNTQNTSNTSDTLIIKKFFRENLKNANTSNTSNTYTTFFSGSPTLLAISSYNNQIKIAIIIDRFVYKSATCSDYRNENVCVTL